MWILKLKSEINMDVFDKKINKMKKDINIIDKEIKEIQKVSN